MGTKQRQADTFQSGCFFVYCFSFIGVSKICRLEDFCRLLSASFPKGINCAPPSTSLSILHCLVVSPHHLHSQSAVLADFASEAFYPPALLRHMQANAHTHLYIRYVFTNMYFRRSFKPAKVHGGLFIEANSVFNLGVTGAASEKPFLFTSRSIWYYLAS